MTRIAAMADQSSETSKATSGQEGNIASAESSAPRIAARDMQHGAEEEEGAAQKGGDTKPRNPGPDDAAAQPQPPPRRVLPTHYKGMPKNWEKNRQKQQDQSQQQPPPSGDA
ncbi:hypothetical protein SLS62_004670 [Diatrype stigma]|uniref:Uncharacterized protein n=1 Tax=Diatrype stigma TaxID=117547 RepID=A0AAN9YTH7_9PEZI